MCVQFVYNNNCMLCPQLTPTHLCAPVLLLHNIPHCIQHPDIVFVVLGLVDRLISMLTDTFWSNT